MLIVKTGNCLYMYVFDGIYVFHICISVLFVCKQIFLIQAVASYAETSKERQKA